MYDTRDEARFHGILPEIAPRMKLERGGLDHKKLFIA